MVALKLSVVLVDLINILVNGSINVSDAIISAVNKHDVMVCATNEMFKLGTLASSDADRLLCTCSDIAFRLIKDRNNCESICVISK